MFQGDNIYIAAHRYILSINCPSVYSLIKDGGIINVTNVHPYIFELFLNYLYTGSCEFFQEDKCRIR